MHGHLFQPHARILSWWSSNKQDHNVGRCLVSYNLQFAPLSQFGLNDPSKIRPRIHPCSSDALTNTCNIYFWHLAVMNYLKPYAVAIASLLAGASVVHNIYKPDLARIPVSKRLQLSLTPAYSA